MKNQENSILVGLIVGVLMGAVAFLLYTVPFNYFDSVFVNPQLTFQIDPINLLSIIVNVVLVAWIIRSWDRKDREDKVERDLLIGYFDEFQKLFIDEVHQMTSSEGVEGNIIASAFKKYDMYMQELINLNIEYLPKNNSNLTRLQESFSLIRELLSNTPREGEVEDGIRIAGTKIFYSPRHLSKIAGAIGKFRASIFAVIVDINRK